MTMKQTARAFAAAILVSSMALALPAIAADWKPTKPIKMLVAYNAGGGADTLARLVADAMEKKYGWTVVVENKPGAAGGVMLTQLKLARPDGYTIGMAVTGALTTNPLIVKGLTYTPDDFTYLGTVAKTQMVLMAKKDAPFNNLDEFVAYAKKKGSASVGSMGKELDLIAQLIAKKKGINLKIVPAKGGAATIPQVLGGHVDVGFNAGAHHKHVTSGALKVIVNLNDGPLVVTPDVKNLKANGIDYAADLYFQFQAPKGLPADVRAAVAKAIDDAVKSDKVADLAGKKMQMELKNLGPDGLTKLIKEEVVSAKDLIAATK
jgi:tripartite-type tricarboxylate transporter receptor subunit TctC